MNQKLIGALKRYAENHVETGGFLRAVLENDLAKSFARADDENGRNLHEIVKYVWNVLPSYCWGSKEKVEAWLDNKLWYCSLECDIPSRGKGGCAFKSLTLNDIDCASKGTGCKRTASDIYGSLTLDKGA